MKNLIILVLGLIAASCCGAVFYLLFTTATLHDALVAILLPVAVGLVAAALVGQFSAPDDSSHTESKFRSGQS